MSVTKRGDTIIEVVIAITVFCMVSIISVTLMNNGISAAEGALETIMARNEIDAQAEALRFIQNSFLAERELPVENQQYTKLWRRLTRSSDECSYLIGEDGAGEQCGLAIDAINLPDFDRDTCEEIYADGAMGNAHAFILNTRHIEPSGNLSDFEYTKLLDNIVVSAARYPDAFKEAPLSPRIVFSYRGYDSSGGTSDDLTEQDDMGADRLYRMVSHAEGIWVIAVRGPISVSKTEPEFFDFYIRTCWYESGQNFPSIIGTIVRLYNPEVVE